MPEVRLFSALGGSVALAVLALATPLPAATLFSATLSDANERPTPAASAATGSGSVLLNDAATQISIVLSWQDLASNAILAHIGPADANAIAPAIIDLTTLLPAPNQLAMPSDPPDREVQRRIIPEPATALLLAAALCGLAARVRRR